MTLRDLQREAIALGYTARHVDGALRIAPNPWTLGLRERLPFAAARERAEALAYYAEPRDYADAIATLRDMAQRFPLT